MATIVSNLDEEFFKFNSINKQLDLENLFSKITLIRVFRHDNEVWDLKIFDEEKLLSGSRDQKIKLWDIKTGINIHTFNGHTDKVNCICVLSNELFASGSDDKTIKIWIETLVVVIEH